VLVLGFHLLNPRHIGWTRLIDALDTDGDEMFSYLGPYDYIYFALGAGHPVAQHPGLLNRLGGGKLPLDVVHQLLERR